MPADHDKPPTYAEVEYWLDVHPEAGIRLECMTHGEVETIAIRLARAYLTALEVVEAARRRRAHCPLIR